MKPVNFRCRPSRLRLSIFVSSIIGGGGVITGMAPLALAQEEEAEAEEIVVTGSRIRRQDFEANSPIVTVDSMTFENTSTIGIETVLNRLPQFIPGVTGGAINGAGEFRTGGSQFASGGIEANTFQTPGASSVNLRGLGAGRNLVLIDGRRGMPVNASMTIDTNSIPSAAIERVEIISGGASAVYGADAVAGAVNFILKDDYEGLNIDTNYGLTEYGDSEEYRVSALWGASSEDGRSNLMIGLEHSSRGEGDFWDRDWYYEDRASAYTAGSEFFFSDTYATLSSSDFSNTPDFAGNPDVVNSVFPGAPISSETEDGLNPFGNYFVNRTPDGTGTVYTTDEYGAFKYNGPYTVDGVPFRKERSNGALDQNQLINPISAPLERYSLFARARYDISENLQVVSNVTFSRNATETQSQYSPAVSFWNATVPHGSELYPESFEDPTLWDPVFNPDGAITGYDPATGDPVFDPEAATDPAYAEGGALGLDCAATGGCTESQVFPKPAELDALLATRTNPDGDVQLNRVLDFLGQRTSENTTTNYQFNVGLEGELGNNWFWDASISHGQSEVSTQLDNFASVERYRAIVESPNYGVGFSRQANEDGGFTTGGVGSCTTGLPMFRDFEVSRDCAEAIVTNLSQNGIMEQNIFEANLTGDLFELPTGPVGFALGTTYRQNDYSFTTADINRGSGTFNDLTMGLPPVGETEGEIKVKEVYGELLVPIVADGPAGLRSLNLELGGRYSDYDTSGSVNTFKVLGDWLVLDWLRARGGYNKALRAPNIQEMFTGRTQQIFAGGANQGDVCSLNNFDSDLSAAQGTRESFDFETGQTVTEVAPASAEQAAQTRAICEALMGEAGASAYYSQQQSDQPDPGDGGQVYVTGNEDVEPEEADTYTVGLVMTSPLDNAWLGGLNTTIDWYHIELDDVIATETATVIYDRCFRLEENPSGDPTNPYCQQITRNVQDGSSFATDVSYTNEARVELSGIDVQLNWNTQLADIGMDFIPGGLGVNVLATFPLKIETQSTPDSPVIDWKGYQSGGDCPTGISCSGYDYQVFTTFNYFNGPYSLSLRWQHYPDIKAGALATNPDSSAIGVHDSYNVFALSGSYRFNNNLMVRGGIENLLDEDPPLAGGNPDGDPPTVATHTTGGFYDPLGRRFFLSLNMTF